jgi:hypothetical protein
VLLQPGGIRKVFYALDVAGLHAAVLHLPFIKGALANPKVPHDVFGLATTLVILYGLDDLTLIESTCFHYPKNQNLTL